MKMTKFVITKYITDKGGSACTVSRADNGMIIGSAVNGTMQFGETANEKVRYFISQDHAIDYLKQECRAYAGRDDIDFLTQEGEPLVQPALHMPKLRTR